MNGALTYKDLDLLRLEARTLDAVRDYLLGRIDSEKLIAVSDLVESAYREDAAVSAKPCHSPAK